MAAPKKANPSASRKSRQRVVTLDASQGDEYQAWLDVLKQRQKQTQKRRAQRREQVMTAHHQRVEKVQHNLKQCCANQDKQRRAVRRAEIQHLLQLMQTKRQLEANIDQCRTGLRSAFVSCSKQLSMALQTRLQSL